MRRVAVEFVQFRLTARACCVTVKWVCSVAKHERVVVWLLHRFV